MAELLRLRQAARLTGVSPGRLYRAIGDGRLIAAPGGGPGKPTLVSLEALQTFCRSEGLRVPDEVDRIARAERAERATDDRTFQEGVPQHLQQAFDALTSQYLARVVERQSAYIDAFLREELTHLANHLLEGVVDQIVERVSERLERSERSERPERSTAPALPTVEDAKASPRRPGRPEQKAALLQRLRAMQAESLSLQAMANRLKTEGVPTLSSKGHWQKGTIGNLLAEEG